MENEKRLIDANAMREDWLQNGENEYVYDANAVLDSIDAQPTVEAVEVPPVKIGDKAYFILQRKIYEAEIVLIRWEQREYRTDTEIRGLLYGFHSVSAKFSDWGEIVFATQAEAQAALDGERKDNG